MAEKLDAGVTFGRWTILAASDKIGKNKAWLCQCSCEKATTKVVKQFTTTSLASRSCGCERKEHMAALNKSRKIEIKAGDTYGRLTVVQEAEMRGLMRYFLCACTCGTNIEVSRGALQSGNTQSCGCSRLDYENKKDRIKRKHEKLNVGDVRGRLTVVEILGPGANPKLKCSCSCGGEKILNEYNILHSNVSSCGCLNIEATIATHTTHGLSKNRKAYYHYIQKTRPGVFPARYARRRATKVSATPPWAKDEADEMFTKLTVEARKLRELTNTQYHVDHIVPLVGKAGRGTRVGTLQVVSGLHCASNFALLPAADNLAKNCWDWPDKPEYSEADLKELKKLHKKTCYNKR